MDREQQIAAIVAEARKQRRATPRALWIAAGAIGALCAIAFAIAMLSRGEPTSAGAGAGPAPATGTGFASGLGLGIAIGLVLGFAIARQVSAHSSRSKP